ncbi:MAG: N-succinylarginine dihydrolase [Planctomycetota bacterium]
MTYREYNFDGLVGPTHNYAGLGSGNLASMASKDHVSSPKAAALEGLAKMKLLAELGVPQAVLPPQRRPHLGYLRSCGYGSEPAELLENAAKAGDEGRRNLAIASSASAMWAANAATVSPSPDTADGRCHFTIANLASQRHRALESLERLTVFEHLFGDERYFKVHPPLPANLPDEGAANHTRFCEDYADAAVPLFVFGRDTSANHRSADLNFRPRQLLDASRAVVDQHELDQEIVLYRQQHPDAIIAGVFHNDVISVANQNVLLVHERAWQNHPGDVAGMLDPAVPSSVAYVHNHCISGGAGELYVVLLNEQELRLADAVRSYLFNSQLVTLPTGDMALIYPAECDEVPAAKAAIERILREDNPVTQAIRVDVRQSMKNGGGPACLRLRVVLSDEERAAVRGNVFWTPELHETLVDWVNRHYRDHLTPAALADVRLYHESEAALDELREVLQLQVI